MKNQLITGISAITALTGMTYGFLGQQDARDISRSVAILQVQHPRQCDCRGIDLAAMSEVLVWFTVIFLLACDRI